jgi:hypothetical protein
LEHFQKSVEERFAEIENEMEKDPDPEMKKFAA